MKIQDLDTPAVCAGAVTSSTIAILPPENLQNYSPGTNGRHEPAKDTRFAWMAENFRRKDVSPLARCVLGWLLTAAQWREDGRMIIGKGEIAERMGIGKRTADRCILELLAAGCLRLVSKGGSLRGQSRQANIYALGTAFEGTPPPLRPRRRGTPPRPVSPVALVPKARPVSSVTDDQCQELHPLPIVPPIHTHTKESPSAFNKETWKTYCLELNPQRDPVDIDRTFDKAIMRGAKDGHWKHHCRDFNSYYKPSTKPQAPAAAARRHFTPAPRPAVRSSCESPGDPDHGRDWCIGEANLYWGLGKDNWIKAGSPNLSITKYRSDDEQRKAIAALAAKMGITIDPNPMNEATKAMMERERLRMAKKGLGVAV